MSEQIKSSSHNAILLHPFEAEVIDTIRSAGPLSRTELARHLQYSRASVSATISSLLEKKILKEVGPGISQGGRRPIMVDVNSAFGYVAGVDIGATSLDLALANFRGEILARYSEPADVRDEPELVLGRVSQIILDMLAKEKAAPREVLAVGIGVPGPVEFSKGVLIAPPLMPAWEGYPIMAFIRQTFPVAHVPVDNDVNVMALGEGHAGTGQGTDNFIFIKIGTGIGCGIICQGKIYRGSNGCAGDVGHICVDYNGPICRCGNAGCLEAMAAGPPMAARATQAALAGESEFLANRLETNKVLTAKDVGTAAAAGDRVAIEIIRDSGRLIGGMLAGLVNFFNPKLILIGGGVSNIGYQLLSSIRQAVLRRSNPLSTRELRIEYSQLGADAGVVGAIELALAHVFVVSE